MYLAFPFEDCTIEKAGRLTVRFEQDHFWYNNPHSLTQIIKNIELSSKGHRKYRQMQ